MIIEEHKLIPNTFGMAARADRWVEYRSEEELLSLVADGLKEKRYLHVGAGSNLLFVGDYRGMVLHSGIRGIERVKQADDRVWLRIGAGETWDDVVAYCVTNDFYGAENLSLIPGETGSAAVQNIGAYGVEVKDLIEQVETIDADGRRRTYSVGECAYGYRESLFKRPEMKSVFITRVVLRLSLRESYHTDYGSIAQEVDRLGGRSLKTVRQAIINIRQSKLPDPLVTGNAGSFFKNPVVSRAKFEELLGSYPDMPHYAAVDGKVKIPAGWLIERCGWKGRDMGRAGVHERQALVLVNRGGATADEVIALSDAVRSDVATRFGITISPEVNIIYGEEQL